MDLSSTHFELASIALACRDRETLLKTFAARLGTMLSVRAVLVWLMSPESEGLACVACWTEPGVKFAPAREFPDGSILLGVLESGDSRRVGKQELADLELDHLEEPSRTLVRSALYSPIPGEESPAGILELLNKQGREFSEEEQQLLEEAAQLLSQSLAKLAASESERQANLSTLERLTALYDIGRTFTSTLELEDLVPIVAGKVRDILGAQACNVWLVDADSRDLYLAGKDGEDPTVSEASRRSLSEGLLGSVAHHAEAKLVDEPAQEPELTERQTADGEFEFQSWMAAPLRKGEEVIGVLELVNKVDDSPFNEEDLFFLSSISEQATAALHNAKLLESERRVSALDALLKISQQITSTLDLDHVLTTVVNQASTVVPFDRCVIGFFDRGQFVLGAVSGETELPDTKEMDDLREQLDWVANQEHLVSANHAEPDWQVDPEPVRPKLVPFLQANQYDGFRGIPLRDEQGKLGAIGLLSSDADFLSENHKEILAILANQTTVAIRNAQLYQQVPLATFLQPFAERKKKWLSAIPEGRRRTYAGRAALAVLVLIFVPWPLRLGTNATVVPVEHRVLSTIDGGVVKRVFVHEGDVVQSGQVLAQLENGESRVRLAESEAAQGQARRELAEAEFRNDPSAAGLAKIRADLHSAEMEYERQRVFAAELRAPISGIVVTPRVEERAGTMLKPGEGFCEIVIQSRMAAEIGVPETDLGLVQLGSGVALKFNSFPTVTFHGTVDRLTAQTRAEAGEQYFLVRAVFDNPDGLARNGMVGRARIQIHGGWLSSGWYPVGYVMLRSPVRWFWRKAWSWVP